MRNFAYSSLDKLPPSIVFQTAAYLREENGDAERRQATRHMVELVEESAKIDLRGLLEPVVEPVAATGKGDIQRVVASLAALISLIEHDAFEAESSELLNRFRAAREKALANLKSMRAILVATLDNAVGTARGERSEARLQRSIQSAKDEAPIYLGSFASYADSADEE
jgi:hypothetical protein